MKTGPRVQGKGYRVRTVNNGPESRAEKDKYGLHCQGVHGSTIASQASLATSQRCWCRVSCGVAWLASSPVMASVKLLKSRLNSPSPSPSHLLTPCPLPPTHPPTSSPHHTHHHHHPHPTFTPTPTPTPAQSPTPALPFRPSPLSPPRERMLDIQNKRYALPHTL